MKRKIQTYFIGLVQSFVKLYISRDQIAMKKLQIYDKQYVYLYNR